MNREEYYGLIILSKYRKRVLSLEHSQEHICFYISTAGKSDYFFSNGINIVFSIAGQNELIVAGKSCVLQPGGLYVVNRFELSCCECASGGKMLSLHIPFEYLHLSGVENLAFACYSADAAPGYGGKYDALRTHLADIFQCYFRDPENRIVITQRTIQLLNFLQQNFLAGSDVHIQSIKSDTIQRIEHLLTYIHEHWNEDLRVSELAAREFLSPNYLSRLIQKTLHCTLTEYITRLRLLHAQQSLTCTDQSVTHISYACGFKNVASFIHYFKQQYGMTPNDYRRQRQPLPHPESEETRSMDMSALLKYASSGADAGSPAAAPSSEPRQIHLSCRTEGTPLRHTWKNLLNVGYAHDILMRVVQEQILRAQKEVGFRYLRFHGILDDDMDLYHEDEDGSVRLNFVNVDLVLDFVLSAGLRPFIELSYVPAALARAQQTPFRRRSFYSMINSRVKWEQLIYGLVTHLIERYGIDEVRQWRFEAISFSLVMTEWLGFEECCEIYEASYRAVKRADAKLLFGGPSTHASAVYENNHIAWFIAYTRNHDCVPDFFTLKNYPYQAIQRDPDFARYSLSQLSAPSVLSKDSRFTKNTLAETARLLHSLGMDHCDIWLVEWSSTLWQRDFAAETCYKSSWIVQTICRNLDSAEAFGYWLLTDYLEEHEIGGVFHGGPGLFTYNGIPKSGWQALRLLSLLGRRLLARGEGYCITASEHGIQLLFYNCTQYDNLYRYRYRTLQNPADAYNVFVEKPGSVFSVCLEDMPSGTWRLRRYQVGRRKGSAFDRWLDLGAPEYPSAKQTAQLDEYARHLLCEDSYLSIENEIELSAALRTHEIELITLEQEIMT